MLQLLNFALSGFIFGLMLIRYWEYAVFLLLLSLLMWLLQIYQIKKFKGFFRFAFKQVMIFGFISYLLGVLIAYFYVQTLFIILVPVFLILIWASNSLILRRILEKEFIRRLKL